MAPRYPANVSGPTITMDQLMVMLKNAGVPKSQAPTFGAIAWTESIGLHVRAVGDINNPKPGYESLGLFQINSSPAQQASEGDQLLTAEYNVQVAKAIHDKSGFGKWTTYTHGTYTAHLSAATDSANHVYAGGAVPAPDPSSIVSYSPGALAGNPSGGDYKPSDGGAGFGWHTITDAAGNTFEVITNAAGDAVGVAATTGKDIAAGIGLFIKAGAWIADRENWLRVFEIVLGLTAGIVGVMLVSRDLAGPAAKAAATAALV